MSKMDAGGQKTTVWFIVGFVVLATVVTIVAAVRSGGSSGAPSDLPAPAITEEDHFLGSLDAQVSLIEYGDLQCPACASYKPLVDQLIQEYGDRLVFAARDFPLYSIHPNAGISAQAAEAAGLQGKYWEMYNLLYEKQGEWDRVATNRVVEDRFVGYAESLGLDTTKFLEDINSDPVLKAIRDDVNQAKEIGVNSTPSFYVNSEKIRNPINYDQFRSIIESALATEA